jgi:hypothetical protein
MSVHFARYHPDFHKDVWPTAFMFGDYEKSKAICVSQKNPPNVRTSATCRNLAGGTRPSNNTMGASPQVEVIDLTDEISLGLPSDQVPPARKRVCFDEDDVAKQDGAHKSKKHKVKQNPAASDCTFVLI